MNFQERAEKIKLVRIVPRYGNYVIEVVYEIEDVKPKLDNQRYASIDIGVNNLMAVVFNTGDIPLLINGKPLKSINQFFNKQRATLMSYIGDKGTSKRIEQLTAKRNTKVKDYLHKQTTWLVNHLATLNITTLYVGWNKGIKQDINLGKRNNQNFVALPFLQLISMLAYKLELKGIRLVRHEESYTSKCSFLDLEPVQKHDKYLGSRIKRGLFKSSTGKIINSDINAAYNIMRKSNPEYFDGIEVLQTEKFPLVPVRLSNLVKKQKTIF